MPKQTQSFLHIARGQEVKITVVEESRNSYRASMTATGLVVRLPLRISPEKKKELLGKALFWLEQLLEKKPGLLLQGREWRNGEIFEVLGRHFKLLILEKERIGSHASLLAGDVLCITLSTFISAAEQQKSVQQLISKMMAQVVGPLFSERVHELNAAFYRKPIQKISYRYNQRVWGSCSSNGKLSFSTRIFLAPPAVRDYLIIHELSHLIEHNHSDRFWATVALGMPDYEVQERWLKKYGHDCQF